MWSCWRTAMARFRSVRWSSSIMRRLWRSSSSCASSTRLIASSTSWTSCSLSFSVTVALRSICRLRIICGYRYSPLLAGEGPGERFREVGSGVDVHHGAQVLARGGVIDHRPDGVSDLPVLADHLPDVTGGDPHLQVDRVPANALVDDLHLVRVIHQGADEDFQQLCHR